MTSGALEGYAGDCATDGKKDTYWKCLSTKTNWILVDLGAPKCFDTIVLKHAEVAGEAKVLNTAFFTIQVFVDGAWKTVDETAVRNRFAITEHAFDAVCSQYIRVLVSKATSSESDKCTRICGIEAYQNGDVSLEGNEDTITPYDVIDLEGDGSILYQGTVKNGEVVDLQDKVLVQKWTLKGASKATLYVSEDGENFVAADAGVLKQGDAITRVMNGARATHMKIEGDGTEYEVTLIGKSLSMVINNQWKGTGAGTRNPHAVKHDDGRMWLPKGEGSGHDVYGLETRVKAGTVRFSLAILIPEEELAEAADDMALFRFDPGLPGGFVSGGDVTVADYKAAKVNEEGYHIISEDFIMAADGGVEGRIVSYRNLSMTVAEGAVYESQE